MIDLGHALEEHSLLGADGATERFGDSAFRSALSDRMKRARRRANLTITIAVVAVIGVGASAWAAPRDDAHLIQPSPSPSAATAAPNDQLPKLGAVNYLTQMYGAYRTSETIPCDIIPIAPMATQGYPYPGSIPALPTWIEADRLYGLPDLFPPNYPIPLYSSADSENYGLAYTSIPKLYPNDAEVVVALIADDGSWWGFDARYDVVDVMPFDPPGMFVTLTPNPECHGGPRSVDGARIPAGHYQARVMVNRTDITYGNVDQGLRRRRDRDRSAVCPVSPRDGIAKPKRASGSTNLNPRTTFRGG